MSGWVKTLLFKILSLVAKPLSYVPMTGAVGFLWRHGDKLLWLATLITRVYGIIYYVISGIVYGIKAYGKNALYAITACAILFMLANMVYQYVNAHF
jgi:hypothetical protein